MAAEWTKGTQHRSHHILLHFLIVTISKRQWRGQAGRTRYTNASLLSLSICKHHLSPSAKAVTDMPDAHVHIVRETNHKELCVLRLLLHLLPCHLAYHSSCLPRLQSHPIATHAKQAVCQIPSGHVLKRNRTQVFVLLVDCYPLGCLLGKQVMQCMNAKDLKFTASCAATAENTKSAGCGCLTACSN